jgi:7-keto-8-aminopelargonate synthetase-like enzyme
MIKFCDDNVNLTDSVLSLAKQMGTLGLYSDSKFLEGRTVSINNKEMLNFTSCSYLGLEHHPSIKQGIIAAVEKFGATFSSSRAFCSSPDFAELEELMAQVLGAPLVITTSTTLGHLSAIPILVQERDIVILDHKVHTSVQMAVQMVNRKAEILSISHNDLDQLEHHIKQCQKSSVNNVWYMVDGVYSMYGDLAPLAELHQLLEKYDNFYVYIDDAHGMSWQGKHGRGYVLGSPYLHPKMMVAISMSKSFGIGGGGAVVFQEKSLQRKVDVCGPLKLFANPLTVPLVGGAIASAKIHLSDEIYALQNEIMEKIDHFTFHAKKHDLPLAHDSKTPIQYMILGRENPEMTFKMVRSIMDEGFYVNAVVYPAVSRKESGCRLSISCHNTLEDIESLVECLAFYVKS